MIEAHDPLNIRCPQLGGEVPFRYCRTVNEGIPCWRIFFCWEFRMDISKFLSEQYSIEQLQWVFTPPSKTKVETILELIERVKKLKENKSMV